MTTTPVGSSVDEPVAAMPESRLFMSSCSRRELARRRPGRTVPWPTVFMGLMVVLVCVAAFLLGHSGI